VRKILALLLLVVWNEVYSENSSGIFQAIDQGDIVAVERIISSGAELNPSGKNILYPILLSATLGQPKITKLLLEKGALPDPNLDNAPLATACANGYETIIELLIQYGANPNLVGANSQDGMTCLMRAVSNGHQETVKLLLRMGSDRTMRDKQGRTAVDISKEIQGQQERILRTLKTN
jgi:uncharacterized protein